MLFDDLDIEKQLSSNWPEQTLLLTNEGEDNDEEPGFVDMALDIAGLPTTEEFAIAGAATAAAAGTALDVVSAPFAVAGAMLGGQDFDEAVETVGQDYNQKMETRVRNFEETINPSAKAQAADRKARWQDQCFLIEGWKSITDKFKVCDKAVKKSGYTHVIPVLAGSSEVVSLLADRLNANLFFNLSPAQLSMLVPTVRLFIVKYKEEKSKEGRRIVVEDDNSLELYLDDFTEDRIVQDIMRGKKGRAEAIGLKSFTYEFDGTDPATTDSLIKVNLKLMFNSFERLTEKQSNGAKFLDLLLRAPKMVKQTRDDKIAKDKDNIYNYCKDSASSKAKKNENNSVTRLNPEYRRIKASVGWAIPPGDLFFQMFPPEMQGSNTAQFRKKVTNLLASLKLDLFLEMTDYDLNFANDGRTELSIDYRGAVEGELNEEEANIFYQLKRQTKKLNKARDEANKKAKQKRRKEIENIKKKNLPEEEEQKLIKAVAKANTQSGRFEDAKAADQIYRDKLLWYSKFIDHLETTHKLIRIEVTKDALKLWRGNREFNAPAQEKPQGDATGESGNSDTNTEMTLGGISAGEILKTIFDGNGSNTSYGLYQQVNHGKAIKFNADTLNGGVTTSSATTPLTEELKKQGDADGARQRSTESLPEQKENSDKAIQRAASSNQDRLPAAPGNRNIYFTFLGDILDTAMNFVNEVNRRESTHKSTIRLLTSQITFTDPYASMSDRNQSEILNIADIPVSLDEFVSWFNNKVIKRGVTDYPILEFIKDAITDLAVRAFGFNCTGKEQFVPVLNYTVFDLPKLQNKREPLEPGRRYNTLKPLREIKRKLVPTLKKTPREIVNYLIIHGSARTFVNRNSNNLKQDERDGIYHFGVGLNRGIVKEINFSSTKLAYGPETRIIDQNVSGIRQLFRKFDANVALYGCPIFRNGQYLFLDARTMGVGSDISRAMGLGGYYNIYNVYGKIDRTNYTVELKCNYQGSGLCGTQTVDRSRKLCSQESLKATKALESWEERPPPVIKVPEAHQNLIAQENYEKSLQDLGIGQDPTDGVDAVVHKPDAVEKAQQGVLTPSNDPNSPYYQPPEN
jgi:hypothetical protein